MSVLYSVILAGGLGSKLWPLSREMQPKQLFKFNDENTLFQKTFLQLAGLVDDKNIITTTNVKYSSTVKQELKYLQEKFCRKQEYTLLTEPVSKNTAPALTLAVKYISELNSGLKSKIILAVPSDQIIADREKFLNIISRGVELAKNGYIVSFSSETTEINKNYGYIKARKNEKVSNIQEGALKVTSFVEKPSEKDKKTLLKGKLYVNSGIYMFSVDTYLEELRKYASEIYEGIIDKKVETKTPSISEEYYSELPKISVDYAIMEKTKKLATVVLDTEWKDIGSWESVYSILKKDEKNNVIIGNSIDIDSENSMIYSTSKLIATLGLKDTFVIETEDAVLVCDKNNTDGIQDIYKKLSNKNSKTKEVHKTVFRPWGCYTVLENGDGFLTKCITVNPQSKLSLQRHNFRSEHWIVLEGKATVIKGDTTHELKSGESIDIDIKELHSLQNLSNEELKIIEVQQGDILDENDIERLEDIYGRV